MTLCFLPFRLRIGKFSHLEFSCPDLPAQFHHSLSPSSNATLIPLTDIISSLLLIPIKLCLSWSAYHITFYHYLCIFSPLLICRDPISYLYLCILSTLNKTDFPKKSSKWTNPTCMTFYRRSHYAGLSETEFLKLGPISLSGVTNPLQICKHPQNVTYVQMVHIFRTWNFLEEKSVTFTRFSKGFCIKKLINVFVYFNFFKSPYLWDSF